MEGVCRVCLAGDRKTYSVAETALEQTYDVVTSDKLQRAGWPTALCCVCVSQLRRCRRFIETARESNDALDRWYWNDVHTDLKLSEQPLFKLTEQQLFHIAYDGTLESGIKQEALEPDNARFYEDDEGTFLTEEFKNEITVNYIQSDSAPVIHDERGSIWTLDNNKDSIKMSDDTEYSSIKTEAKYVWVSVTDGPELKQQIPMSARCLRNKNTASTSRKRRNMFSCTQCTYSTANKSHLKRHSLTHKGKKQRMHLNVYSCSQCSYTTTDKSHLKRHSVTHIEKSFACDNCDYKCTQKSKIKKHIMSHTGDISFACDKCDYKSFCKSDIKKHLMIHTGESPFMCDKCGYKCYKKSRLHMHLLTHTSQKPFACDKCDYKCRQKNNLKMHLFTHTGEKPFACDKCSFSCNLKKNLKIHYMTHTDEKPFMCDKCDYKCRQSRSLRQHLMTHTGEKPFACDKCDYKCSVKAKLKRHSLTHDKNRIKN